MLFPPSKGSWAVCPLYRRDLNYVELLDLRLDCNVQTCTLGENCLACCLCCLRPPPISVGSPVCDACKFQLVLPQCTPCDLANSSCILWSMLVKDCNIICWNVRGLNDGAKRASVRSQIISSGPLWYASKKQKLHPGRILCLLKQLGQTWHRMWCLYLLWEHLEGF